MRSRLALALLTLAVASAASSSHADDTPRSADAGAGAADQATPATSLTSDQRRDPSRFRGRTSFATADEVLSWIPRVLFFPLYLFSEYVLRVPSVAGAAWMDRNHVVPILDHVFNPTPDIHWAPTLALDSINFLVVGVEARWRNFLVRGHEISGSAETSAFEGWRFKARDSWQIGKSPVSVGARGMFFTRQDLTFYGLGPSSKEADQTYYSETLGEGFAFAAYDYRDNAHLELSGGFRDVSTGGSSNLPSIQSRFWPTLIPGLGEEIGLATVALDLRLDSRIVRDQSGGFRVVGNASYARDVQDSERSFLSTLVDAEGAIEVSRPDRVLSLRGRFADTFALGQRPVPFTEQPMLGWSNHFGFHWGRFRGESALMAEVRYRYPIAYFIDMQWILSVGNVFSHDFGDFNLGALTTSMGVGFRTRRTDRTPLELVFALGTSRFDEAFDVQSVGVYLATTEGL